jgi:hypothetical protein
MFYFPIFGMQMNITVIILSVLIFVLAILNIGLFLAFVKTNKKIDELLEKGKIKDFKDIFLSQKEKNIELEKRLENAFLEIAELQKTSKKTFQKLGVVRYNPFNDMGGNQSFIIALLDEKNNGFVLSSFFDKEGSRIFTKTVKQGKSDRILSKEEEKAIEKAINS